MIALVVVAFCSDRIVYVNGILQSVVISLVCCVGGGVCSAASSSCNCVLCFILVVVVVVVSSGEILLPLQLRVLYRLQ